MGFLAETMRNLIICETWLSDEDVALAEESSHMLSTVLQTHSKTQQFDFHDDNGSVILRLSFATLSLLQEMLTEISKGHAVSIISTKAELTTEEAANVLNVSLPFFEELLEKGEIPLYKTDTYQYVRHQDMINYRRDMVDKRLQALNELAAQGQKLGMGY
jgi:excisionase family DNA binding protein